jgi:hypothetical protein
MNVTFIEGRKEVGGGSKISPKVNRKSHAVANQNTVKLVTVAIRLNNFFQLNYPLNLPLITSLSLIYSLTLILHPLDV